MACVGLLGGCCGGGGGGCGCGRKKRSADVEWLGQSGQNDDFLCNSAHLRNLPQRDNLLFARNLENGVDDPIAR
ncbi:unnamed protein product, partial [Mesorhabditis belari]|uniref:Uncharacterized protein n=1 Tax=Mesorhabditis belari TaxID=2138241 RepID=A0AAF3FMJ7_9BILA